MNKATSQFCVPFQCNFKSCQSSLTHWATTGLDHPNPATHFSDLGPTNNSTLDSLGFMTLKIVVEIFASGNRNVGSNLDRHFSPPHVLLVNDGISAVSVVWRGVIWESDSSPWWCSQRPFVTNEKDGSMYFWVFKLQKWYVIYESGNYHIKAKPNLGPMKFPSK